MNHIYKTGATEQMSPSVLEPDGCISSENVVLAPLVSKYFVLWLLTALKMIQYWNSNLLVLFVRFIVEIDVKTSN